MSTGGCGISLDQDSVSKEFQSRIVLGKTSGICRCASYKEVTDMLVIIRQRSDVHIFTLLRCFIDTDVAAVADHKGKATPR